MPDVSIYCQVHQPYRLRRFRVFDVGRGHDYFDDAANRSIVQRVAAKCYVPSSRLLADLIRRSDGGFRIALSLSGVLVEQLAAYAPVALAELRLRVRHRPRPAPLAPQLPLERRHRVPLR